MNAADRLKGNYLAEEWHDLKFNRIPALEMKINPWRITYPRPTIQDEILINGELERSRDRLRAIDLELAELAAKEDTEHSLSGSTEQQASKTTHRLKTRRNILDAVIETAKRNALDPADSHSHWAALVALAESPDCPAPLLGYVEGEGVKYLDSNGVKFLSRKSFLRRVRPAKDR